MMALRKPQHCHPWRFNASKKLRKHMWIKKVWTNIEFDVLHSLIIFINTKDVTFEKMIQVRIENLSPELENQTDGSVYFQWYHFFSVLYHNLQTSLAKFFVRTTWKKSINKCQRTKNNAKIDWSLLPWSFCSDRGKRWFTVALTIRSIYQSLSW